MRRFAVLLLALVFCGESADAQRRGGPPPGQDGEPAGQARPQPGGRGGGRGGQTAGTAVIQGVVIAAETGAPVRRADVRATSSTTRGARMATTNDQGRFVLADLPAGQWSVTASKGGFVPQQYGQQRPLQVVPPIELADGERRTLSFGLWRGGAITGQVFDEYGDPITGARLQLLRLQTVDGQRRLVAAGVTDQSDDRGMFRLYGLAPGDYYVTATVPARTTGAPAEAVRVVREAVTGGGAGVLADGAGLGVIVETLRDTLTTVAAGAMTYAPTYYPGTPHAGEAQRISLLLPGEEVNATFTLQPVRTVQVSGRVVSSAGEPATATVNLMAASGGDIVGPSGRYSGVARTDGTFAIAGVVPGAYVLQVATRGRGNAGNEVALLPIAVGAEGLGGLHVTTGPGGSLAGTVAAVGAGSAPATSGMQVIARAVRGGRTVQASVSGDGSFRLTGLVGPYAIEAVRLPTGWMLESVVVNGVDVTETPMDFRGTEQVTGVRVVLTDRLTQITGTVRAGGQPVTDATVVIFPQDAGRWAFPARFLRTARGGAQGTFTAEGLPPGAYLAVAVTYLQQGEWLAPEFLQSMRARATPFSLAMGGRASVDLRIVER